MPETMHALFIDVEVTGESATSPELAKKLEEACPVDIFAADGEGGSVRVVRENLDECVLCRLCLDATPPGDVTVKKLYDGTTLEL